ncbi:MAG: NAD-dependent epimerase/dehydratase family protein, partial [Acidobacteria bacterium]|nr:NAD-dependent epimerase/dehydratase family protein [Acidobacteriota bacterium]
VIPEFILRMHARENPFRIYGGQETRAFCYVDDAVRATMLVAAAPACDGEIVHIGNQREEVTIETLATLVMDQFGNRVEIKECGGRSGSVSRRCPNTSKLKHLTGFEAQVDLKDGLALTRQWYLSHAGAPR